MDERDRMLALFQRSPRVAHGFLRRLVGAGAVASLATAGLVLPALLSSPPRAPGPAAPAVDTALRAWLAAVLAVQLVQVPLRAALLRSLAAGAGRRRDATLAQLAAVIGSAAWRADQAAGSASFALFLLGCLLLSWATAAAVGGLDGPPAGAAVWGPPAPPGAGSDTWWTGQARSQGLGAPGSGDGGGGGHHHQHHHFYAPLPAVDAVDASLLGSCVGAMVALGLRLVASFGWFALTYVLDGDARDALGYHPHAIADADIHALVSTYAWGAPGTPSAAAAAAMAASKPRGVTAEGGRVAGEAGDAREAAGPSRRQPDHEEAAAARPSQQLQLLQQPVPPQPQLHASGSTSDSALLDARFCCDGPPSFSHRGQSPSPSSAPPIRDAHATGAAHGAAVAACTDLQPLTAAANDAAVGTAATGSPARHSQGGGAVAGVLHVDAPHGTRGVRRQPRGGAQAPHHGASSSSLAARGALAAPSSLPSESCAPTAPPRHSAAAGRSSARTHHRAASAGGRLCSAAFTTASAEWGASVVQPTRASAATAAAAAAAAHRHPLLAAGGDSRSSTPSQPGSPPASPPSLFSPPSLLRIPRRHPPTPPLPQPPTARVRASRLRPLVLPGDAGSWPRGPQHPAAAAGAAAASAVAASAAGGVGGLGPPIPDHSNTCAAPRLGRSPGSPRRAHPSAGVCARHHSTEGQLPGIAVVTKGQPGSCSGAAAAAPTTAAAGAGAGTHDSCPARAADADARDTCAVCLAEFEHGDAVAQLPCSPLHVFHAGCVWPWLRRERRCPLCVADIDEPPPPPTPPPHSAPRTYS